MFTTLAANPAGYTLNSITVKGNGDGNGYNGLALRLSSVSGTGSTATLTTIGTVTGLSFSGVGTSDYVTYTLSGTPVILTPGTQYAFDFYATSGYYGFADSTATSGAFQTEDKKDFNSNSITGNGGPFNFGRTFDVGLTPEAPPAPEPSQYATLGFTIFGVLGLMVKARRRKAGELTASIA